MTEEAAKETLSRCRGSVIIEEKDAEDLVWRREIDGTSKGERFDE